jgi:hypothetical protein
VDRKRRRERWVAVTLAAAGSTFFNPNMFEEHFNPSGTEYGKDIPPRSVFRPGAKPRGHELVVGVENHRPCSRL